MSQNYHAGPKELFERLDKLSINYKTLHHKPVYTVKEAQTIRGDLPGGHSKNLFLRNKKGKLWLVTCEEQMTVDLKLLASRLEAGRLSFGSPELLHLHLGVIPGAVTPFAVINDFGSNVDMILDRKLLSFELLNFHPLVNTQTTSVQPSGLLKFLGSCQHAPQIIDI